MKGDQKRGRMTVIASKKGKVANNMCCFDNNELCVSDIKVIYT